MAPKTKLVGIVTKIDKVSRDAVGKQLLALSTLLGPPESEVVPVSAKSGEQVEILVDVLAGLMDEGPAFYPDGELTDEPEEVLMAELIREAALEGGLGEELPHSLAVVIEEVIPREGRTEKQGEMLDVHALLYVERPSQKGIVIGKGGGASAGSRYQCAPADREAARCADLPGAARQGRQGLAARPEAARPAGLLGPEDPEDRRADVLLVDAGGQASELEPGDDGDERRCNRLRIRYTECRQNRDGQIVVGGEAFDGDFVEFVVAPGGDVHLERRDPLGRERKISRHLFGYCRGVLDAQTFVAVLLGQARRRVVSSVTKRDRAARSMSDWLAK